jgi:hypothetical protein
LQLAALANEGETFFPVPQRAGALPRPLVPVLIPSSPFWPPSILSIWIIQRGRHFIAVIYAPIGIFNADDLALATGGLGVIKCPTAPIIRIRSHCGLRPMRAASWREQSIQRKVKRSGSNVPNIGTGSPQNWTNNHCRSRRRNRRPHLAVWQTFTAGLHRRLSRQIFAARQAGPDCSAIRKYPY